MHMHRFLFLKQIKCTKFVLNLIKILFNFEILIINKLKK
jgi:hypothetical protein